MSVSVTIISRKYLNPVANVAIDVDYPVFDESHVRVIYGVQGLTAVLNTDFTVTLSPTDFSDFQITPTASLRTKIDAMIAADPTEVDQIVVRRSMPLTTDMTATLARLRDQIALEFDRTVLRAQEMDDKINGAIRVPDTEEASLDMTLPPVATRGTKFLVFNADGTPASSNRTLAEVEAAPDAEAAKVAAEAARDEAVAATGTVKVSDNDTTAADLEAKLLASGLVGLSTQNDGANETRTVDVPVATQLEAEAGTSNIKALTPLRGAQLLTGLRPAASQAEMEAGAETALRGMSPLRVKQAIEALGSNRAIQVVHSMMTTRQQMSPGGSFLKIPGLAASITPTKTTNKILVMASVSASGHSSFYTVSMRLYRNDAYVEVTPDDGNRPGTFMHIGAQQWINYTRQQPSNTFLDSPNSVEQQTYTIWVGDIRDNSTVNINRGHYDANAIDAPVGNSSITLMEIEV